MARKKVPEQKNKSLEELEKNRIQAEINKLQTEIEKLNFDREWKVKKRRREFIASFFAIILVVAAIVSIIIPLTQTSLRLSEVRYKLAEAKSDSAHHALAQAEEKEQRVHEWAQRRTARLDSINQFQKIKLDSLANRVEQERAKSKKNQKEIKELESQRELLTKQIRDIEGEKKQIEKIVNPTQILSGRVITREDRSKIPLNGVLVMVQDGSIKDTTDQYGSFKLEIPAKSGGFKRITFSKPGYIGITRNLKLPNQNIVENLERAK